MSLMFMFVLSLLLQGHAHADHAMGFDQDKTVHHFVPTDTGGYIDIAAKEKSDASSRDAIRMHLEHIATMFKAGDFSTPMLVHDESPDGVDGMKRLSREINYSYSKTANGGRLTITTKNREALTAIHDFLKYQIREHHTGDDPNGSVHPKRPAPLAHPAKTERR